MDISSVLSGIYICHVILVCSSEVKEIYHIFLDIQTFLKQNSGKKTEEILPNQKINKWKLLMKLHSDIINKDFDGKLDIVEEI